MVRGEVAMILANRLRVPELNPLLRIAFWGGLKIANRSFKALCANRPHVMKIGFFVLRRTRTPSVILCPLEHPLETSPKNSPKRSKMIEEAPSKDQSGEHKPSLCNDRQI